MTERIYTFLYWVQNGMNFKFCSIKNSGSEAVMTVTFFISLTNCLALFDPVPPSK